MQETKYRRAEARFWSAHGLKPSERFVRLTSTGTRVRVLEVGDGEPVLFIHGGPNAGSTWVPLLEHLDGFRCLLVDRPGTGLSEPYPLRAAQVPEFGAAFVADVLDGLRLERAHVVASSFGGHLALRSAAHRPERFGRMVQMACPALVPNDRLPPFMKSLTNPLIRRMATLFPPSDRMAESIMRQIGHGASLDAGRIPASFRAWWMALQRFTATHRHDFETIASLIREQETVRLTPDLLGSVDVSTLFLWGADDTFGDESVARALVSMMPDATLTMIREAGHLPWIDFPTEHAKGVATFLTEDRAAASMQPGGKPAVDAAAGSPA